MVKKVTFKNIEIRYSDEGSGPAILLLHGYLESLEIWESFVPFLSDRFRIICPDLPGHGKSGVSGEVHTMEFLAEGVAAVLDHCAVQQCMLIGHSMGGYTGLAFLELFPERLKGLCLFHSHPFPDSKQTMNNRCREIVLVNQGRKELISRINIPKAFAPQNIEPLATVVEKATKIAIETPDEGIIACLNGMMQRPSRENLLSATTLPVMLIAGKYDDYIPFGEVAAKIRLPENSAFLALENSGHIGFLEEPEIAAHEIIRFIELNL